MYSLTGNISDINMLAISIAELYAYVDADRAQRAAPGVQGVPVKFRGTADKADLYDLDDFMSPDPVVQASYPNSAREVIEMLIACHEEPACPAIDVARQFLCDSAQQTPPAAVEMGPVLIDGIAYQRPVIRVAVVTVDGASCTVPVGDLLDMLEDTGKCTVEIKTMSKREFDELPEFTGF